VVLLVATGFFARIEPSYISQDASAGNRLTLWKGGLQMIAASPWRGWGEGKSGPEYMHWFQPLEAKEAYAGMVNSYLHVGVEHGLPVLVAVLAAGSALVALSLPGGWLARGNPGSGCHAVLARVRTCGFGGCIFRRQARRPSAKTAGTAILLSADPDARRHENRELGNSLALAGGASLVVFAIANVFSTLWIFGNLWWLPALDAVVVMGFGFHGQGRRFVGIAGKTLGVTAVMSLIFGILLVGYGRLLSGEVRIGLDHHGNVVVNHSNGMRGVKVLVLPDRTVLGETWGKEIRRLAAEDLFRDAEIGVSEEAFMEMGTPPGIIIACGARASEGLRVASRFPETRLILVHPLGRPAGGEGRRGRVTVLLPGLDTVGSGKMWRRICKQHGWECVLSPGVGQDVRSAWPGVLARRVRGAHEGEAVAPAGVADPDDHRSGRSRR